MNEELIENCYICRHRGCGVSCIHDMLEGELIDDVKRMDDIQCDCFEHITIDNIPEGWTAPLNHPLFQVVEDGHRTYNISLIYDSEKGADVLFELELRESPGDYTHIKTMTGHELAEMIKQNQRFRDFIKSEFNIDEKA